MAQTIATTSRPAYQAYQILYIGFIVAPASGGARQVHPLPHELGSVSRSRGRAAASGLWSHVHALRRDR